MVYWHHLLVSLFVLLIIKARMSSLNVRFDLSTSPWVVGVGAAP